MNVGSAAGLFDADLVWLAPHQELTPGERPSTPPTTRSTTRHGASNSPGPARSCGTRRRTRLLGLIPQRVTAPNCSIGPPTGTATPQTTTTTVLVPPDHSPGDVRPVLSYQCAIDAVSARCFPLVRPLRHRAKPVGCFAQFGNTS